jgi:tRNA-dihydrouridine synthase
MPAEARVPAEMRIGTVLVAPATVLAPMAGVTDTVFRRFIRHASLFTTCGGADAASPQVGDAGGTHDAPLTVDATVTNAQSGCGLLMTEFTSADGLATMNIPSARNSLDPMPRRWLRRRGLSKTLASIRLT